MAPLKTLLSTAALAFMLLLGAASNAVAAGTVPCWKQVISDWYDGRIDNVYPLHCYHEAIAHLPEDVQTYSSAKDEINRALLAALRHDRDGYGGAGGGAAGAGAGVGATASGPEGPGGGEAPGGVLTRLLETLGPSNAESVPLPLLVLAVIALLLLAAAAASFVAKRVQARRPPGPPPVPATAPAHPPKQS
jgi:hypothetical protein